MAEPVVSDPLLLLTWRHAKTYDPGHTCSHFPAGHPQHPSAAVRAPDMAAHTFCALPSSDARFDPCHPVTHEGRSGPRTPATGPVDPHGGAGRGRCCRPAVRTDACPGVLRPGRPSSTISTTGG